MIAASTREELQQKVQAWKDRLEQYGMRLNIKKTEYVECGEQTPGTIFVDDADLPKVSAFKYLWPRISANGSTLVEAEHRANAAWRYIAQWYGTTCGIVWGGMLADHLEARAELHTMEMRMLRWTKELTRRWQ
ncbi:hypothetical protein Y032_0092g2571 [Ancylostoma ceylanicum]|uniref:Reverse transcriptase domain-containing protein n=1 Tax=Ancylostoma ceylanicum TaxID=53326 RepID=A0A016TLU2_9BILA|nr:hypothetical protein Y032_0092g2571 [Ancylostoma ceylanicum]